LPGPRLLSVYTCDDGLSGEQDPLAHGCVLGQGTATAVALAQERVGDRSFVNYVLEEKIREQLNVPIEVRRGTEPRVTGNS